MATAFVMHRVKDYDSWKTVYDSVSEMQAAGGVIEHAVYRVDGDPHTVLVMHRFASSAEAHAFFEANPALMETLVKAGVYQNSLRIEFFEEV